SRCRRTPPRPPAPGPRSTASLELPLVVPAPASRRRNARTTPGHLAAKRDVPARGRGCLARCATGARARGCEPGRRLPTCPSGSDGQVSRMSDASYYEDMERITTRMNQVSLAKSLIKKGALKEALQILRAVREKYTEESMLKM